MLGNNNYIDLTGQMEEVFDSKIQQINFLTEDNVKDKIEEAVAEIEIKPELFDDVYAKKEHSHTVFNHGISVNGNISTGNRLELTDGENKNYIDVLNSQGGNFIAIAYEPGGTEIRRVRLMDTNGNSDFPGDLTVNGELTVKGDVDISSAEYLFGPGFQMNSTEISLFRELNCENNGAYFGGDVIIDGDLTVDGVKIDGSGVPDVIDKSITISGDLNVSNDLTVSNRVFIRQPNSSPSTIVFRLNGALDWEDATNDNVRLKLQWDKNTGLRAHNVHGGGTEVIAFGSQTITHKTNIIGEIGTFCETNGGIYTGYDKIAETDCICQVVQSNTLNSKIVGIITSETQFASHGDVLVKIVPGTYHLGDILCPDITGKARIATETELQYMMLHAIPRPKITSLDTKIEGTVACFIV